MVALLVLAACSNPYQQFYTDRTNPVSRERMLPPTGRTEFVAVGPGEMQSAVTQYLRRGYMVLGEANFEARAANYGRQLRNHAKELGTDVVLMSSQFARDVTGTVPLTTYNPQISTTYSQGHVNANVYGSGGSTNGTATYSGTSTTYGPGTYNTTLIPFRVERDAYHAVFLRKANARLGAFFAPLSDAQRAALQRNGGVVVTLVVDDSPAFVANLLVGDIIIAIEGQPVTTIMQLTDSLRARSGQKVTLTVIRGDKELALPVALNP